MRLLVTGGCGFIGANFIYMMLEKHPDMVIVNLDKLTYAGNRLSLAPIERSLGGTRYHFVHGDIANSELTAHLIATHKIDAVVNFAAESHVDRSIADCAPFVLTNVLGAQALLDTARRLNVPKYVHVSTDEVYGTLGPEGKFTEETPLAPNSPYSASKASADLICRAFFETYGYPVVVTRCSNNYGPFQFPEKLIPLMIMKASRGEALPVYGDGLNVRDWIYVADHCRGVELALLKGRPGQAYNFGGNAEKPNIEVVTTILAALGKPQDLITYVKDRPGHDRRYAMDYSLAQRELGFAPQYTFETGIERTLAWYKDNAQWLDQVQSGAYRTFMDHWYGDRR